MFNTVDVMIFQLIRKAHPTGIARLVSTRSLTSSSQSQGSLPSIAITPWWRDTSVVMYLGGMLALSAHLADKHFDIRKWTTTHHRAIVVTTPASSATAEVSHGLLLPAATVDIELRSRVRAGAGEAGQGCVDWPAGRVLLQWCPDGGVPLAGAHVLEIGAGVGLASIGLAKAAAAAATQPMSPHKGGSHGSSNASGASERGSLTTVVAADVCPAALENLQVNAAKIFASNADPTVSNGSSSRSIDDDGVSQTAAASESKYGPSGLLRVLSWNAAGGASAVAELAACGVHPERLTRIIGAGLAR